MPGITGAGIFKQGDISFARPCTCRLGELASAVRGGETQPSYVRLSRLYTEWCKSIPACLNFRGLAPARLSYQPQHAKSAIFGKIGRTRSALTILGRRRNYSDGNQIHSSNLWILGSGDSKKVTFVRILLHLNLLLKVA